MVGNQEENQWRLRASCLGMPVTLFHEESWTAHHRAGPRLSYALSLCRACPVRTECLLEEVAHDAVPCGIRGGARPPEITALRRNKGLCRCGAPIDDLLGAVDRAIDGTGPRWRCSACRGAVVAPTALSRRGGAGGAKGALIHQLVCAAGPLGLTTADVARQAFCSVGRVYEVVRAREDLTRVAGRVMSIDPTPKS